MANSLENFSNTSTNRQLTVHADHLKHFLLNKKAHRWLFCEWFYSDIDWCLWKIDNEFRNCFQYFLPEHYKYFHENNFSGFTRRQWNVIRSRLGKPRRFSSAFLEQERKKLVKQRKLLRICRYETTTHYRSEETFSSQLPSSIVAPLKSGAHVLVRLFRSGQFILARGHFISHLDNDLSHCKILFDDSTLGLINVNDFDVMSEQPIQQLNLAERLKSIKFGQTGQNCPQNQKEDEESETINDDDENNEKLETPTKIPDRLLYLIIRISRIVCAKRDAIENLKRMNDQAIFERSERIPLSDAFRQNYAQLVQWIAKLNTFLAKFLDETNKICREIVHDDQLLVVFNEPKYICDRSENLAKELINKLNSQTLVTNQSNLEMITKLVALLVQMKDFTQSEGSFLELHAIDEANKNFQSFLDPSLLLTYKRCVETSLTQFKSGLNNRPALGPLQSFLHMKSNSNDQQNNSSSTNQTFFSV